MQEPHLEPEGHSESLGRGNFRWQLFGVWRRTGSPGRDTRQSECGNQEWWTAEGQPESGLLSARGLRELLQPGEKSLPPPPPHLSVSSPSDSNHNPQSCSAQPDIPARSPWQPDEEEQSPEPQPWSLPSLQDTPSLEEVSYSKNSCSQPSSDISSLPTAPSATSTDPSSQEDPEPSPPTELDLGTPQSPCSRLLTGPTQPGPPERPQLPGPTEANPDALWTLQSSQPPPHSSSPEDPRKYPPQVLLGHVQPLKELGALTSNSSQISNLQGFQARQPRVADLKKCFEN